MLPVPWFFALVCALVLFDDNAVFAVQFRNVDGYVLGCGGWNVLSHVIGPNGQPPMTSVDEYCYLDSKRPPRIPQPVEGGAASVSVSG